jgi:hypothetical protein
MDLLWQRLDGTHDDVSFAKVGGELRARWAGHVPASRERDERGEIGRYAVLEIVRDVCERAPELEFDWFAVGLFH